VEFVKLLEGRLVVVTGANSGVGRSVTELLVHAGADVVMVCRNADRGRPALAEIVASVGKGAGRPGSAELEIADLADFDSVRTLGARLGRFEAIHALVNNAGVWRTRLEKSPANLELTMATNHLGHFLLTSLLFERLLAGGRRVINVSSEAHRRADLTRAPLDDIVSGAAWKGGLQAYSDSKLANILFTAELVRRYGDVGLIANSLHPGVLRTRIWNKTWNPITALMRPFKPLMGSPAVGGRAVMRLLQDPERAALTNTYFKVERLSEPEDAAFDRELARELWETSQRSTGHPW
jgi:NAD(P)-dependent dehydrogenase (short-subunit alcohol dehydrogenase family)